MKLWIIYKGGLVISRVIVEMLQDRLESYIDVSVGRVSKIEPWFILEEHLDYLILGDITSNGAPSLDIQKWLSKYKEISEKLEFQISVISGFLILKSEERNNFHWMEFVSDYIMSKVVYPPILSINFKDSKFESEDHVYDVVKEYCFNIIGFITNSLE
jgi:hypothetical protein